MHNPLLSSEALPPFSQLQPDQVEPAVDQLLSHNRERIAALLDNPAPPTWASLVQPIEILEDRLGRAWAPVRHLNSVRNTPELRAAYNACLPKLSDYATEMGHNQRLHQAYRAVREGGKHLDRVQLKVLDNALRDFHLAGVDLPPDQKERFKAISQRLSQLASRFEERVLDATHAWTKLITDPAALQGLPESALALARQTAEQRGLDGWLLTLEYPSYQPLLTYADDRELRQEVYRAYVTRASDQGPDAGKWNNGPLMEEILALRHEEANLLGFANFAELSLATKMAPSPEAVVEFLLDLARRSRPQAEQELAELATFAKAEYGHAELAAWDMPYYAEKLRQQRYSISQEQLRPYFPVTKVVPGLFAVVERLFGILIEEIKDADVWHPDVRFYVIRTWQGELCGHFYLDLYARPQKRGGAWMDGCIDRMIRADGLQTPVAFLKIGRAHV
jgi:oligopeptidase A